MNPTASEIEMIKMSRAEFKKLNFPLGYALSRDRTLQHLFKGGTVGAVIASILSIFVTLIVNQYLRRIIQEGREVVGKSPDLKFPSITTWLIMINGCISVWLVMSVMIYSLGIAARTSLRSFVPREYVMTPSRLLVMVVEIFINGIHPNMTYYFNENLSWYFRHNQEDRDFKSLLQLIVHLPIFLRIYWLHRALEWNMPSYISPNARLIAAGIGVRFGNDFHTRNLMSRYSIPLMALIFTYMIWALGYILWLCEETTFEKLTTNQAFLTDQKDYWYFASVTALTIGYGDFTPKTVCGRWLCLSLSLTGTILTSVLTAVVVVKLQVNRRELFYFLELDYRELLKRTQPIAAMVIQQRFQMNRIRNIGLDNLKLETNLELERAEKNWRNLLNIFNQLSRERRNMEHNAEMLR